MDKSDGTIALSQRYGLIAMEQNCHEASGMTRSSANGIFVWQQLSSLFKLGRKKS